MTATCPKGLGILNYCDDALSVRVVETLKTLSSPILVEVLSNTYSDDPLDMMPREWLMNLLWATPDALITALALDLNPTVRYWVACSDETPTAVLTRLAVDADEDVRWAVAHNDQCPTELLDALLEDDHPDVRASAQRTLDTTK